MVRVFVVVGQMYQTWRRPRAHHLRPSPSRTLLGNEQTAGFLRGQVGVVRVIKDRRKLCPVFPLLLEPIMNIDALLERLDKAKALAEDVTFPP